MHLVPDFCGMSMTVANKILEGIRVQKQRKSDKPAGFSSKTLRPESGKMSPAPSYQSHISEGWPQCPPILNRGPRGSQDHVCPKKPPETPSRTGRFKQRCRSRSDGCHVCGIAGKIGPTRLWQACAGYVHAGRRLPSGRSVQPAVYESAAKKVQSRRLCQHQHLFPSTPSATATDAITADAVTSVDATSIFSAACAATASTGLPAHITRAPKISTGPARSDTTSYGRSWSPDHCWQETTAAGH